MSLYFVSETEVATLEEVIHDSSEHLESGDHDKHHVDISEISQGKSVGANALFSGHFVLSNLSLIRALL